MSALVYFCTALFGILFWIWMCTMTVDGWGDKPKVYSIGYTVLFCILFLVPVLNFVLVTIEIVSYVALRFNDELKLKSTKFTRKWFGIE